MTVALFSFIHADLIKQCPRKFLNECAQKIVLSGRKPEYLDLFVGMTQFSRFAAASITGVEAEISSYLTAREWKEHVLMWCCSVDSEDYKERKREMERVAKQSSNGLVTEDDLTSDLKYHVRVLVLLANCSLGPKIHAILPIHDLLSSILDPATIFPVRKALANLLIEVVKSSIDRVEKSDLFWQLLEDMSMTLETLPTDYVELSRSPVARIQRGEWIEIIASLAVSFFEGYDFSLHQESREKNIRSQSPDPRVIIDRLYKAIKALVDYHGAKLGNILLDEMTFALSSLSLHVDVDNLDFGGENDDDGDLNEAKLRIVRLQHQRASIIYSDVQQVFFRKQFGIFLKSIQEATPDCRLDIVHFFHRIPWVKDQGVESDVRFEPLLKKLSAHFRMMIKRSGNSRELVSDDDQANETCAWLLCALRHLLEHEMKATFDNITDVDVFSVHNTAKLAELRMAYNVNGITFLCLDLISNGIETGLKTEAIKLLIVMLLRNPDYADIQQTIYSYLLETDSLLFFETMRDMIENLKSWSAKESESEAMLMNQMMAQSQSQHTGNQIPDDMIVLYLLQSICEGEDCRVRDQIREQKGNSKVVNILESVASYVGVLSRGESMITTYLASITLRTVLRLVQGPCKGNQEQFVLNTELLMAFNRIIRALRPANHPVSAIWAYYLEELKEHLVDSLRGLIEGQPESSLVYDRVSSTIDVGVLHILILANKQDDSINNKKGTNKQLVNKSSSSAAGASKGVVAKSVNKAPTKLTKAQAKYLVFTQSLGRTVETYQSLTRIDNLDKSIAHVEIVWKQRVETVYFAIPEYVKELSAKELDDIVDNMDDVGASREMKLSDFIERCKNLYQRLVHQQFLKRYGLSDLWPIKYYLARFMFANAFVMCVLLLLFYGTTYEGHHTFAIEHHRRLAGGSGVGDDHFNNSLYFDEVVSNVMDALNVIQIICAIFIFVILCIVQLPVVYYSAMEKHKSSVKAFVAVIAEPLPIWYLGYLLMAVLAIWVNRIFITVLLLDWVILDRTSQDLLLAIQYPARQLITTLIIIVIVLNIFAGVDFVLFRHDFVTLKVQDMWDAFKICISYGFRGEYGVDHEMNPTIDDRMILDVVFYFVVGLLY
ncbi:hypothetical protein EON65_22460 [archaeon]|nr:MAG: hypothetical protein EON65_22460 [archaeon]